MMPDSTEVRSLTAQLDPNVVTKHFGTIFP
jgi:hypothetical protein